MVHDMILSETYVCWQNFEVIITGFSLLCINHGGVQNTSIQLNISNWYKNLMNTHDLRFQIWLQAQVQQENEAMKYLVLSEKGLTMYLRAGVHVSNFYK